MFAEEWSTIAEVVGAVGVIVTLIYLAVQVHQNTRQMRSQGLQTALKQFLTAFENATASVQDADIFRRGLKDFDDLSASEQGVFHSKLHAMLVGFNTVWNLHKDGLVPDYELDAMRSLLLTILRSPGGTAWWTAFKHVPPPVLVHYLDDSLDPDQTATGVAAEPFPWFSPNRVAGSTDPTR